MTFEKILPYLKNGYFVRRREWSNAFCIYIEVELNKGEYYPHHPNSGVLLIEVAREGISEGRIISGWRPHAIDLFNSDWEIVALSMQPIKPELE